MTDKKDVPKNMGEVRVDSGLESRTPGTQMVVTPEFQKQIDEMEKELEGAGIKVESGETKIIDVSKTISGKTLPMEWNLHVYYRDMNGMIWAGDITAKRLNNRDIMQVGVLSARLAGGMALASLDENTQRLVQMMAYIAIAIKKAPAWWQPEDMYDNNVVAAVYNYLSEKELTFRSGGMAG